MVDIIIRQSRISDVDEINELEKLVFSPNLRYGPSIIITLINTALPHLVLTALLIPQNKIVGFIAGEIDDTHKFKGRIITIEVDPEFQHHEIGYRLLYDLEQNFVNFYSIETLELQVHYKNQKAINFYRKHGFFQVKRLNNYYERNEHALLMQKSII